MVVQGDSLPLNINLPLNISRVRAALGPPGESMREDMTTQGKAGQWQSS